MLKMVINFWDVTLRQAISIVDMESLDFQDEFGYLIFANFSKNKETKSFKILSEVLTRLHYRFLSFQFF